MRTLLFVPLLCPLLACGAPVDTQAEAESEVASVRYSSTPSPIELSTPLHLRYESDLVRDRDRDFLDDHLEAQIAERVVPWMIFSEHENARAPNEPVTLYQVIPRGCTGEYCPAAIRGVNGEMYRYKISVKYGLLWAEDGGYVESDCDDSHPGDSQSMMIELVSNDGRRWFIDFIDVNTTFRWPAYPASFRNDTHLVVYFSAGKHHHFLDTSYDGKDSPSSDWGCNDAIDANGAQFYPDLTSPYADHRPNNVGEVEAHPAHIFIDSLASFGYSGYSAWGDEPFYDDANSSIRGLWSQDLPAPFSGFLPPQHGSITGFVSLEGDPASRAVVYYKEVDETVKPWGVAAVGADGRYSITVRTPPLGKQVLLRPVSSDHDFESEYGSDAIPRVVWAVGGVELAVNFQGRRIPLPPSSGEVVIGQVPTPPTQKGTLMATRALRVEAPAVLNAQSSTSVSNGTYFWTGLPYSAWIELELYTLLDAAGDPATSEADTECTNNTLHPRDRRCSLGAPVAGATLEAKIIGGTERLEPSSSTPIVLTTNSDGKVSFKLTGGAHPGNVHLSLRVTNNPANPFFRPVRTFEVRIHPDSDHEDGNPYFSVKPYLTKRLRAARSPG